MSKSPSLCYNDSERRWAKRYHDRRFNQRHYATMHRHEVVNITVPDDVERLHEHSPCFNCESRGPCRHRPWMLQR